MKVSMRIILQTPTRVTLGSRYTPALPRALSQCSEPGPGSPPASGRTAPAVPPPGPAEQRAAPSARRLPPFPKNKTSPLLRPAFGALSGKPLRDAGEGRGRLDPSPPGTEAGAGAGGPHLALGQAEPPAGGGPASPGRRLPSRDAARRSEQRPRPGGCGPDAGAPVRPSPGGGATPVPHQRGPARQVLSPPPPVPPSVSVSTAARSMCGPQGRQNQLVPLTVHFALTCPTGDVQLPRRQDSGHLTPTWLAALLLRSQNPVSARATPRTRGVARAGGRGACWELRSSDSDGRSSVVSEPRNPALS